MLNYNINIYIISPYTTLHFITLYQVIIQLHVSAKLQDNLHADLITYRVVYDYIIYIYI